LYEPKHVAARYDLKYISINYLIGSCVRLYSRHFTPVIILSKHNRDVAPENLEGSLKVCSGII
jgi:hypothetical protein